MSRIGKLPIELLDNMKVEIDGNKIEVSYLDQVKNYKLSRGVVASVSDSQLKISATDTSISKITMFVGMDRSNLNNIVSGLRNPFVKILEINGVGYKFLIKDKTIIFSLGYSHDIVYVLPSNISASFEKPNKLILTGEDKISLGRIASEISSFIKVEPYKGKGIRSKGQFVLRKEGKKK